MKEVTTATVFGALMWGCAALSGAGDLVVDGMLISNGEGVRFSDGSVQPAAAYPRWAQVAVVDAHGRGDFIDPVAAMDEAWRWCPSPSAASPCLVKILPGYYDIGDGIIYMQPYVDIEGSGRGVTRLRAASDNGVVQAAGDAELRSLTIVNEGAGSSPIGIWVGEIPTVFRVTDVDVVVVGDNTSNTGVYCGASQLVMDSVDVQVAGGDTATGVLSNACDGRLHLVGVVAQLGAVSEGVRFAGSVTPQLDAGRISVTGGAVGRGIYAENSDIEVRGVTVGVEGSATGVGLQVYDANARFTDGAIAVHGGTATHGVSAGGSGAVELRNARIEVAEGSEYNAGAFLAGTGVQRFEQVSIAATGGDVTYAVRNAGITTTIMVDVIGRADGAATYNYGVNNHNGSTIVAENLTIEASGGGGSYGVLNTSSGGSVSIDRSRISGGNASVRNDNSAAEMFVGASKLDGPVTVNLTCFGNYDATYTAVTCP